ncbi:chaperonin 10-like protein [Exophiala viscosa]|uniref:Chaperonin 10-like protein n=1 Tax=Exophiala viscosa TaxID=2486360 RepID=A0AAN6DX24_9EURO|nr:chaperonin 10-like protein [Exophiala viscosa]KAI1626137.1 chaperonin 10-like protein [Exophiala viscosa]
MAKNQAAFLDGEGSRLRVGEAPMPQAETGRIVIRNRFLAVNPADWKVQDNGFFIRRYPIVLGEDVAGDVVDVGEGVTHVKKGDRVIAHLDNLATQKVQHGGFALYCSAPAVTVATIPSDISYADASVLPTAFDTAAVGLYSPASEGFLGLPFPSANPPSSGKIIVVWGGSSSVGALAIQLAVASGVKVVAIAGGHNFDFCKKCGASEVISYKKASVVDDVAAAVKSVGGAFTGVYDAVSLQDQSYKHVLPILEKLGGGNLATVLPVPDPKGVAINIKCGNILCISPLTHPLWKDYVAKALESGQLKCLPEPAVIGKGLECCQTGLDENKRGVSARKVIIEL